MSTVSFDSIIKTAEAKSGTIQGQVESLQSEKAALDKLAAEAKALSPETVALIDSITNELTAAEATNVA